MESSGFWILDDENEVKRVSWEFTSPKRGSTDWVIF